MASSDVPTQPVFERAGSFLPKWVIADFQKVLQPTQDQNSVGVDKAIALSATTTDPDWIQHYVTVDDIIRRLTRIYMKLDRETFLGSIWFSHCNKYRRHDIVKHAIMLAQAGYYIIDYRESLNDSEDIKYCDIFIIFYCDLYAQSQRCLLEAKQALLHKRPLIIVTMEAQPPMRDWPLKNVRFDNKPKLFCDYSTTRVYDEFLVEFLEKVKRLTPDKTGSGSDLDDSTSALRRRDRNRVNFETVNVPVFSRYYTRREDEMRLLNLVRTVCQYPDSGALVVAGEAGIGKTTIVAHLFTRPANTDALMAECKIFVALWLNCYEWRIEDGENGQQVNFQLPAVQKAFLAKIVEAAKKADPLVPSFLTFAEVYEHFVAKKRRLVLILDDVFNPKLLQYVRATCKFLPLIVITRDLAIFAQVSECYKRKEICKPFTDEQLVEMFGKTYELSERLSSDKLAKIAQRCLGSPLIASLVATRFVGREDCEVQLTQFLSENIGVGLTAGDTPSERVQKIVRQLFDASLSQMDESQRISFNSFLFFEPSEPVSAEDVAFLWGFEGSQFRTSGILKARALCHLFEKRGLIQQIDKDVDQDDRFTLNQTLHEVAYQNAKRVLRATDLPMIRLRLVTGSARVPNSSEDSEDQTSANKTSKAKKPDINIMLEAIIQQNFDFLWKLFDKLAAFDLAVICGQKSSKTAIAGRNFLHHLYHSKWSIDERFIQNTNEEVAKCAPNASYKLIEKFLLKVSNPSLKLSYTDIFKQADSTGQCLLWDLFDDEDVALYHNARLRLICKLSKLRGDYLLSRRASSANQHRSIDAQAALMVEAVVKGDLDKIKSDMTDSKGDTPLMVAARLGRVSLVESLTRKHWETIGRTNFEGQTALAIASFYGHLDVIQAMFRTNNSASLASLIVRDKLGRTAFMNAAKMGHLETLEFLLEKDPKVLSWQDSQGYTALAHAAMSGHVNIVVLLSRLEEGLSVRLISKTDQTPLQLAVIFGHLEIVQYLCNKYPDALLLQDSAGQTPLLSAAASNNFDILHCVYDCEPQALNVLDKLDRTALMLAAGNGHLESLEFLAEHDAEGFDKLDLDKWTVLHYAAKCGSIECVQFVFSHNPDAVELANVTGETPAMIAAANGHLQALNYLYGKFPEAISLQNENGFNALMLAAEQGHLEVVDFIHQKNKDAVQQVDNDGRLPIMIAVKKHNLAMARNLFEKYPEALKQQDNNGFTAALHAVREGSLEMLEFINEMFSDSLKLRDHNGTTPLMLASQYGYFKIVDFLVKNHPESLRQQNIDGYNALMLATIWSHSEIVQLLHNNCAESIKQRDVEGRTAFAHAALHGNMVMVQYLGEQFPPCLKQANNDGKTPTMLAAEHGHLEIVAYLCDKMIGAPQVFNIDGQPPLFHAAAAGKLAVVKYLFSIWPPAIHLEDVNGKTALQLAQENKHQDVVDFLSELV